LSYSNSFRFGAKEIAADAQGTYVGRNAAGLGATAGIVTAMVNAIEIEPAP